MTLIQQNYYLPPLSVVFWNIVLRFGIHNIKCIFLLFALRNSNWHQNVRLSSYQSRLLLLNLPTLVNRRTRLGTILNSDSVELVNRLTFNVPVRLARNYYPQN